MIKILIYQIEYQIFKKSLYELNNMYVVHIKMIFNTIVCIFNDICL